MSSVEDTALFKLSFHLACELPPLLNNPDLLSREHSFLLQARNITCISVKLFSTVRHMYTDANVHHTRACITRRNTATLPDASSFACLAYHSRFALLLPSLSLLAQFHYTFDPRLQERLNSNRGIQNHDVWSEFRAANALRYYSWIATAGWASRQRWPPLP